MIFSEAEREFQIRHYNWAISEFEREIRDSFPNLRLFNDGVGRETFLYMQTLDQENQIKLARALLRDLHKVAAKALGEKNSPDDNFLIVRRNVFGTQFREQVEAEIAGKRRAGETIKFASKRRLQKMMAGKFKEHFGNQVIGEISETQSDPWSLFTVKLCGWDVATQLYFGRHESVLAHWLSIDSPTKIHNPQHPEITAPAMRLGQCISWLYFREMKHIPQNEIEISCDTVIKCCRQCLDGFPQLLKGMEFETITQ